MITVISLGAGVQSSTMALMAARGEITPMPDCAIFADTQSEPKHVYEYLDWLEKQLPFPVYRVTAGSLRDDLLSGNRVATPPLYAGTGMLYRQCTVEYKIQPIRKKLKEMVSPKRGEKNTLVSQWIGISQDEIQRMKYAQDKWVENRWPLIEMRMTRLHCIEWMMSRYDRLPKKSACTFCPYHDNATWRDMKENDIDSWNDAVQMDYALRTALPKVTEKVYLHSSRTPLEFADISNPAKDQMSFLDECDGMCGV